jgi:molybdopterin-guanine dinucleotide biosynthesis protein A
MVGPEGCDSIYLIHRCPISTIRRDAYDRVMQVSAVILSGGRSRRFGGLHKPGVDLGGTPVIARILASVLAAVPDAEVRVAGPLDGLSEVERERVVAVREKPKFAGPLAGIAAAVAGPGPDGDSRGGIDEDRENGAAVASGRAEGEAITLIVAGDMPLVTSAHLRDLIAACAQAQAPAVGYDDRDSMQFLCAAWPTGLLRQRLREIGDPTDRAVKLLYSDIDTVRVEVDPTQLLDFDTPGEFGRVQARMGEREKRPVPGEVSRLRERVAEHASGSDAALAGWRGISAADTEAVLDFASRIKHSDSSLSPVLAAFLAGRVHARGSDGESVAEALAAVEAVLKPDF